MGERGLGDSCGMWENREKRHGPCVQASGLPCQPLWQRPQRPSACPSQRIQKATGAHNLLPRPLQLGCTQGAVLTKETSEEVSRDEGLGGRCGRARLPAQTPEQEEVKPVTAHRGHRWRWGRCCCHSRKAGLGEGPGSGRHHGTASRTYPETPPAHSNLP